MSLDTSLEMMDLTTTDRVRSLMGTQASSSQATQLLGELIGQVSAEVLHFTERHGPLKARTETYQLNHRRAMLRLDGAPISVSDPTTTVVRHATLRSELAASTPIDVDDFLVRSQSGILRFLSTRSRFWSLGTAFVQITYTCGLAADTDALLLDPTWSDLVQAVTMQVRHAYQRRDGLGGAVSITMAAGTFTKETSKEYGWLEGPARVFQRYRRSAF